MQISFFERVKAAYYAKLAEGGAEYIAQAKNWSDAIVAERDDFVRLPYSSDGERGWQGATLEYNPAPNFDPQGLDPDYMQFATLVRLDDGRRFVCASPEVAVACFCDEGAMWGGNRFYGEPFVYYSAP